MAEGLTGGSQIEKFQKGDKQRTAQHADVMNEIIDKLNTLLAIEVKPNGKFIYSDGNVVLDLDGVGGEITVTDETTTVASVTTISLDGDLFTVSDGGGGIAEITLKTIECECDDTTIDGGSET